MICTVVDLDGTLLNSDLLVESAFIFLRRYPYKIFMPIIWLLRGKAYLKHRLAENVQFDVGALPYNDVVIEFLRAQKDSGKNIVLATASHKTYADRIAEHLGIFDRVIATKGEINLSALNKRDILVSEFGEQGFDYIGNSRDDLPVWKVARKAYIVNPELGVERRARSYGNVERVMRSGDNKLKSWIKALRIHQWVKNLLIFVPLIASHRVDDPGLILDGLFAFFLFSLCASSVYLLNDLLDLEDDRHHPTKRHRPFASGALSIKSGIFVFPLLLAGSLLGAAWLLPWQFVVVLAVYYAITLAYSSFLKRKMMLDVITLALLYTIRIIAGVFACNLVLTFWMLAFSMFIFLDLALVKRYAELRDARERGETEKARGRGYYPGDLEMIAALGASAGFLAVMVLALYIQDQTTTALYQYPEIIWLACPLLLFWVSRVWMLTHRGEMHDDPVIFALKDKTSLWVGVLFGAIFWLAS